MAFFLSYAKEDSQTAGQIAAWLKGHGHQVYDWLDPAQRGGRFINRIEQAIRSADAFFAVLSPNFTASPWCGRELDMAIQLDLYHQATNRRPGFIHVLQIREMLPVDAGFLGGYDWLDLTDLKLIDTKLGELMNRLGPARQPAPASHDATSAGVPLTDSDPAAPMFRNRQDELVMVLRGLANAAGPHFWLVIAPPQLGKTWFVNRVAADIAKAGWMTKVVDLRQEPPDVLGDVAAILERLFGLTSPLTIGPDTFFSIAQRIVGSETPHLCVLDGAELLDEKTTATVRSCLSQIYRLVRGAGRPGVRLGLIVASRRDDQWRGVSPDPRLCELPLTEFKPDVVRQALQDLALEMRRTFPTDTDLSKIAATVHRLSEGLPAVLARCLEWIQQQHWMGLDRLEGQELFEQFADPYIRTTLLTRDSLFPRGDGPDGDPLNALEQAYRVLVPYRLFTQSHLKHHCQSDEDFRSAMQSVPWSMEDLWKAISGTALLRRPLNEPWQEICAPIRRLLHRYYYATDADRAEAHSQARRFVTTWADQQNGTEQVIGLVECVWHEATVLRLRQPAELERMLSQSVADLSAALRQSPAYTPDELRSFASDRMRDDEELKDAVSSVDGLFTRLAEIVLMPPQEP